MGEQKEGRREGRKEGGREVGERRGKDRMGGEGRGGRKEWRWGGKKERRLFRRNPTFPVLTQEGAFLGAFLGRALPDEHRDLMNIVTR